MTRRARLSILTCAVVWGLSVLAAPTNLLKNGSFESVSKGQPRDWSLPEYWSGTLATDETVGAAHGGKRSVVLHTALKSGRHWGRMLQLQRTRNLLGPRFRYTMWARGKGTFLLGGIEYRSAEKFTPHYQYRWQETETVLTDAWQQVTYEFSIMDPEVIRLALVAEVRGEGSVAYLDDAEFATFVQPGISLLATPPHAMVPLGQQAEFQVRLSNNGTPVTKGMLTLLAAAADGLHSTSDVPLTADTTIHRHDVGTGGDGGIQRLTFIHPESGAVAQVSVDVVPPELFREFEARAEAVKLPTPARLLIIGDSLTDQQRGENYVDKLAFWLERKLGPNALTWRNAGVGGDYISRVWQRMQGEAKAYRANMYENLFEPKPSHVFFFLGHNDTKVSSTSGYTKQCVDPVTFEEQYRLAIQKVKEETGATVIVLSATSSVFEICKANADKRKEAGKAHNMFGKPEELERFNAIAQRVAADLGCEFLDVYEPTRTYPDKPSLFNARDGVHLSAAGNRFIALQILKHLGR
ncbi:MAG: hypothetical protein HN742_24245 [Lentisphaerae bacterium]|jgi:lysophospholipase L1-like esterase|nr:hypothetical protein [Lentisphaerota bacterium]MBT5605627.1 hypothetical protein [Lentisphaerota bacterium]MBT7055730.1 hypothetical protein [Lentisphaerota bacterium]MBT7845010.1 hypothetical protein [Lentisphaerota bacterium]